MDIPSWVWLPVAIVPYIVIFFLFIVWVSDSDYPSAKRLRSIWSNILQKFRGTRGGRYK